MRDDVLVIHEIYASIQGESSFAGLPCAFVRTTGCNLRCSWCDTPRAFHGGEKLARAEVLPRALALNTPLVEVTGGEPLLQPGVTRCCGSWAPLGQLERPLRTLGRTDCAHHIHREEPAALRVE